MNEENQNRVMTVQEIPVTDIAPNPYQPRLAFDDTKLSSMADSISRYGVMQPIVVTKRPDGTYELISGERRLRASKIAGKETIPAVIRDYEHSDEEKFELAIIENIQREDLSPSDKAHAFEKLANQFGYTHSEIAQKMGKSREYISNSLRLLLLPDNILAMMGTDALTEGHARPLLMLKDRPFEQGELFKKIVSQKLTVRAADKIARSIATEKLRKLDIDTVDSEIKVMEKKLAEKLGTKVHIDEKSTGEGGKLTIEYFSKEDLEKIINLVKGNGLSTAPVIESSENNLEKTTSVDSGIEKFQDNFSDEKIQEKESIGKQVLQSAAPVSVFADEIENLSKQETVAEEKPMVKINIEEPLQNPVQKEEEKDEIDGYNISFGAAPKQEEIKKTIITEDAPAVEEDFKNVKIIDNFATGGWKQQQGEDDYQKELEKALQQRQLPQKEVESSVLEVPTKKHDITELTLDNHAENISVSQAPVKENIVEGKISVPSFSKADFMMQARKQQESNPVESREIVHENTHGNNLSGKTAAQQRIDDILAGRKTVAEEYGVQEKPVQKIEVPIARQKEEIEEDIEDSSIYQQFLDSKKKIEDQKDRMFSGSSSNEVDNVGSFSESTSSFTVNKNIHIGSESQQIEDLKQERDMETILRENFGKSEIEKVKEPGSEAQVENIFGGSGFIPKNNPRSETQSTEHSREAPENQPEIVTDNKYSFKGFSI